MEIVDSSGEGKSSGATRRWYNLLYEQESRELHCGRFCGIKVLSFPEHLAGLIQGEGIPNFRSLMRHLGKENFVMKPGTHLH